MDINDFHVRCINLEGRTDRWEESQKEFAKVGLEVLRFPAEPHSNPIVGCAVSHFTILTEALSRGKHAMIFEDDVQFLGEPNIQEWLFSLDYMDWDMLYFGANITTPISRYSKGFGRLSGAQSTHAYCVNNAFIQEILNHSGLLGKHMDLIYSEDIIPHAKCYITIPIIAIQRPSYSDIEKKPVDYSWMVDRYYRNLTERLDFNG